MASVSQKSSLNRILLFVFAVAFGIVGLALAFKGVKTSSDIRSRASQEERIVQGWEFDGSTTEDWEGVGATIVELKPIITPNQALVARITGTGGATEIQNNTVKTLPSGFKRIIVRMAVGARQQVAVSPTGPKQDPTRRPTPTSAPYPFSATIALTGNRDSDSFTGSLSGPADNLYHEYAVTLPQTLPVSAGGLKMAVSNAIKSPVNVSVDWIHIVVTNPSVDTPTPIPTSRPTPVCRTVSLQSITYTKQVTCKAGYAPGANFTCTDGYLGYTGAVGTTCALQSQLKAQASQICLKRTYCPTPVPTRYPTPYPTGGGCVTQCNILTNECTTVCPTAYPTSYPTPTPTPS